MDPAFREDVERRFMPPPSVKDADQRQISVVYCRQALEIAGRFGNTTWVEEAFLKLEESRNIILKALRTAREQEAAARAANRGFPQSPRVSTVTDYPRRGG